MNIYRIVVVTDSVNLKKSATAINSSRHTTLSEFKLPDCESKVNIELESVVDHSRGSSDSSSSGAGELTEKPLDILTKIAKALNPRQMQLSRELRVRANIDLPGLDKMRWRVGDPIVSLSASSSSSSKSSVPTSSGLSRSSAYNDETNSATDLQKKGKRFPMKRIQTYVNA